jgi:hypothetical protein
MRPPPRIRVPPFNKYHLPLIPLGTAPAIAQLPLNPAHLVPPGTLLIPPLKQVPFTVLFRIHQNWELISELQRINLEQAKTELN